MNYECCKCKGIFPVEDAIDGFDQGYKVGFLCPLCGCNIKDNPITAGYVIKSKLFLGLVGLYTLSGLVAINFYENIGVFEYGAFGIGLIFFLTYGYFKHPDLFKDSTSTTELGPGKN